VGLQLLFDHLYLGMDGFSPMALLHTAQSDWWGWVRGD